MTLLLLTCLWALAATLTAFLPMRLQIVPGLALLIAAPALIAALGWSFGPWVGMAALAGFVSMFRHPLAYLVRRTLGGRRKEADR